MEQQQNNLNSNHTTFQVEVVEIYPDLNFKPSGRYKERGTCHVYLPQLGIDIKNIFYAVFKKDFIFVSMPMRFYETDKGRIEVPYISFTDKSIELAIRNAVRKEILTLLHENRI